jgi:hypothetical protein
MWQSLASLPEPLRYSRASGSVVEACVSLRRRSPWKSRSALRPPPVSPGGGSPPASAFGLKLFMLAKASIKVPSTEKCSAESSALTSGWPSTAWKNCPATSPAKNRSRFLVNTVTSQIGASIASQADEPAEQQIVIELFHELALRTHRIEGLQQQGPQQLLGRDRRPADVRVEPVEGGRQHRQRLVDDRPDRP